MLRGAVNFLDQCRAKPRAEAAAAVGAVRDAKQWVEEAARQVIAEAEAKDVKRRRSPAAR